MNSFVAEISKSNNTKIELREIIDKTIVPRKTSGYSSFGDTLILPPFISANIAYGSGNIEGTVQNLMKILRYWQNYELISEDGVRLKDGSKAEMEIEFGKYKMMWTLGQGMEMFKLSNGKIFFGKGGQYPGYASHYVYDSTTKDSVLILTNLDSAIGDAFELGADILLSLEK